MRVIFFLKYLKILKTGVLTYERLIEVDENLEILKLISTDRNTGIPVNTDNLLS